MTGGRKQSVLAAVAGAGRAEAGDGGVVATCHEELGAVSADMAEASFEASQDTGGSRHDVFCHS